MARIEPDITNPDAPIEMSDIHAPDDFEKGAALQLVVQDTKRTESWLQQSYWTLRWRESDALYQAPPGVSMWEGTTVPRSNVNRFVVGEVLNSIHPQIINGLFYEKPAFVLRPQPSRTENATRAITSLLSQELTEMNIRQEFDWGVHSALLFGTCIFKWGFETYTKKTKRYVRQAAPVKLPTATGDAVEADTDESDTYQMIEGEEQVHHPTCENKDIRYTLVDSATNVPDIRKAKFVIDRMYKTYRDLIKLKDEQYVTLDENGKQTLHSRYDLPDEATIKSWFEKPNDAAMQPGNTEAMPQGTTQIHHATPRFKVTTADPLDEPLEILERWDGDKVITVLQRVKVIRNEKNEFGEIPFLSCNWWNISDAFWGMGLGRIIGVEQRVQAGLINACLDLASLIVNPMFVRARGANVQTQQIRQRIGGILDVDVGGTTGVRGVSEALTLLQQPVIPAEVINQIGMSESRTEKSSGASSQFAMGAPGQRGVGGQAARSGTGAAAMIQATMTRIGGFSENFVSQIYEPLLYKMHQLNKDKMPTSYVRKVLGEKLGPEFKFDMGEFLNAQTEFSVLAGSHLAAKAQMAQSLFMMIQLFESPALMEQLSSISHKKVNVEELFHMVHDVSGWGNYYDIIQDMTPEEAQRQDQMANPGAAKLQGQMQINQQKADLNSQAIDQENEARITRDIFRHVAEVSAMPEALSGQPGEQGFGAESGESA